MSFTKNYLDQNERATENVDALYDAEYLEFLRDQDLERRMSEESVMILDSGYLSEVLGSMPNEIDYESLI